MTVKCPIKKCKLRYKTDGVSWNNHILNKHPSKDLEESNNEMMMNQDFDIPDEEPIVKVEIDEVDEIIEALEVLEIKPRFRLEPATLLQRSNRIYGVFTEEEIATLTSKKNNKDFWGCHKGTYIAFGTKDKKKKQITAWMDKANEK